MWTDGGGMVGRLAIPVAALEAATLGADGVESVVLRYGAFYGPGTYYDHGGAFASMVARRLLPVPRGAQGLFGFVDLGDAVAATVAALDGPTGVFNVVDDVPAPTSEWVPYLATLLGAGAPFRVPNALMRSAGQFSAYLMCAQPAVSNARARAELGWSPRYPDWHQGLAAALTSS